METLPFNKNINVVQLVSVIAMLMTLFGVNLDAQTQAAVVSVILGVSAIVTWVLHTFVNHPANKAVAAKMMSKAASGAGRMMPLLAILLVLGVTMSACAAFGQMTPQDDLNATRVLFETAEATYDSICSVSNAPGFCTNPADQAAYQKAKIAIEAAISTAQAAITASNNVNSASIAALLQAVENDWNAYNAIVASTKAKARALGLKVPD